MGFGGYTYIDSFPESDLETDEEAADLAFVEISPGQWVERGRVVAVTQHGPDAAVHLEGDLVLDVPDRAAKDVVWLLAGLG